MDENVVALMRANLYGVFSERDDARRLETARSTYAEDGTFADEDGTIVGPAVIAERAAALLARVPASFTFTEEGPVYTAGNRAALAWRFGPPDGEPAARGLDLATIAEGRIVALETLLG